MHYCNKTISVNWRVLGSFSVFHHHFNFLPFAYKDKSRVSSARFRFSPKAHHRMTFEVTNDSEDEKTLPSSLSKDHLHDGDHKEIMTGPQTETNKGYEEGGHEEMEALSMLGQNLDLGNEPEEETLPKRQDSVEPRQGKDELHEEEVEIGKMMSVNSQTEQEKRDRTPFLCEEHEEQHVVKSEKETDGESALTEGSPELHMSCTEGSQLHESETHIRMTEQQKRSALEDGETSQEAVMHGPGEKFPPKLSTKDLPIADCELGLLASQAPTMDKPDEVLDPKDSPVGIFPP